MLNAFKSLDLNTLPADAQATILVACEQVSGIVEQNAALTESNATLTTQVRELEALNARLEHFVKELNQVIYGARSEKLTEDERQLAFEDIEVAQFEAEEQSDTIEMTTPRKTRKPAQRNLGNLPDHLERIEEVIEPDSVICPCGCGDIIRIGEDRAERLEIIPTQPKVIVTVRPKYACQKKRGGIVQALAPVHLIEGGLPTEGTLAHIGVSKYADHCPLFRQSQIYARSGLNIERSTLANWMGKVSFHLAPVVDHMFNELKSSSKLFADETRCHVLDLCSTQGAARPKQVTSGPLPAMSAPLGGTAPPGVVFCYADGRGGKHATEFLTGFSGTLQVDGYTGDNALTKSGHNSGPVKLAYCWAHARRKLKEVHDRDGSPIAGEGHKRIAKFYKIEDAIRGQSVAQRTAVRQERTKPLMDDFEIWLKTQRSRISAKSRLGEKLSYIAKYMGGLKLFLDDGSVEMDSNIAERAIRPIALSRKNALFAGHD
jgi:transposase